MAAAQQALLKAMLDPDQWEPALDSFAKACGGRTGQLIALDGARQVTMHRLTEAPDGSIQAVEDFGLSDPNRNPRVRAGLVAPLMRPLSDQDYVSSEDRSRLPIYTEMFEPLGFSYNCQVVLMRTPDLLVRTSVSRTSRQGPFDDEAMRALTSLLPYMQAIVRAQAALGAAQVKSAIHTLDAVDAAAFVLGERQTVLGVSARGAAVLDRGDVLRVSHGRLSLSDQGAREVLNAHLLALRDRDTAPRTMILPGGILDLTPLPIDRSGWGMGPAVLAILREPRTRPEREAALRGRHGLTQAEAAVAVALAEGRRMTEIARLRGVSMPTVRAQVQSAYAKMGVRRQAELVARVRASRTGD